MASLDTAQPVQIETTHVLHAFNYGVSQIDDTTIVLELVLLKSAQRFQLPFDRLAWTSFVKGLQTATERMQSVREMAGENGSSE